MDSEPRMTDEEFAGAQDEFDRRSEAHKGPYLAKAQELIQQILSESDPTKVRNLDPQNAKVLLEQIGSLFFSEAEKL